METCGGECSPMVCRRVVIVLSNLRKSWESSLFEHQAFVDRHGSGSGILKAQMCVCYKKSGEILKFKSAFTERCKFCWKLEPNSEIFWCFFTIVDFCLVLWGCNFTSMRPVSETEVDLFFNKFEVKTVYRSSSYRTILKVSQVSCP